MIGVLIEVVMYQFFISVHRQRYSKVFCSIKQCSIILKELQLQYNTILCTPSRFYSCMNCTSVDSYLCVHVMPCYGWKINNGIIELYILHITDFLNEYRAEQFYTAQHVFNVFLYYHSINYNQFNSIIVFFIKSVMYQFTRKHVYIHK